MKELFSKADIVRLSCETQGTCAAEKERGQKKNLDVLLGLLRTESRLSKGIQLADTFKLYDRVLPREGRKLQERDLHRWSEEFLHDREGKNYEFTPLAAFFLAILLVHFSDRTCSRFLRGHTAKAEELQSLQEKMLLTLSRMEQEWNESDYAMSWLDARDRLYSGISAIAVSGTTELERSLYEYPGKILKCYLWFQALTNDQKRKVMPEVENRIDYVHDVLKEFILNRLDSAEREDLLSRIRVGVQLLGWHDPDNYE